VTAGEILIFSRSSSTIHFFGPVGSLSSTGTSFQISALGLFPVAWRSLFLSLALVNVMMESGHGAVVYPLASTAAPASVGFSYVL